jgi:hypothetical protein
LGTTRVFDKFDSLEAANQATRPIQDALSQEFGITTVEQLAGDVTASA